MGKRKIMWCFGIVTGVFLAVTFWGTVLKAAGRERVAPGIRLFGRDISGMSDKEVRAFIAAQTPEVKLELICCFPAELKEKIREQGTAPEGVRVFVTENRMRLESEQRMLRPTEEKITEAVLCRSREVSCWEWLYEAMFGVPFATRKVTAEFDWEEAYFSELLDFCEGKLTQKAKSAELWWDKEGLHITEDSLGYGIDKEKTLQEARRIFRNLTETAAMQGLDGAVVRIYVYGEVTVPKLTAGQAGLCNTKIGEFVTSYVGAGEGRMQNIQTGAAKLHGTVVLPGEELSVSKVLLPFTEENGYTFAGSYVNGRVSESMGGGVCQLSTTLYNALLYTELCITERQPHSLPVGYVPLGRDAAIAENLKDLRFRNTSDVPVLILCDADGAEVKVTLYGDESVKSNEIVLESVVAEETREQITVNVYRTTGGMGGATFRELVSVNRYKKPE